MHERSIALAAYTTSNRARFSHLSFARRQRGYSVMLMLAPLLLNELGNQAGPAGLMARAQARAIIAMKIFMEEDVVAPMLVALQERIAAVERPPAAFIAQEEVDEPVREVIGNRIQRQILPRAGGAFDQKIITIVVVELLQGLNQQIVDREPDRTAPVRVTAKQAAARFGRLIAHRVGLPIDGQLEGVGLVIFAQRAHAIRAEKLVRVEHAPEQTFHAMAAHQRQQATIFGPRLVPARNQACQVCAIGQEPLQPRLKPW